jgi:dolichol-phosphate mannosyltransferase
VTELSVVIPARNEAANIRALLDGIVASLEGGPEFEVIVVDDGSTDATGDAVRAAAAEDPRIRLLSHARSAGQSAAVHSGVEAAKGRIVATLDGDGQNPPEELPGLVAPLFAPDAPARLALVAGQRVGRQDTWSKKAASRFANGLRGALLKDGTRDTGCGLKAFRRDVFLTLPYFDHMHRYLPALFGRDGWEITHVDVSHRPRSGGRSKYTNLERGLQGMVDLLGVMWLIRRRKKAAPVDGQPGHPRV